MPSTYPSPPQRGGWVGAITQRPSPGRRSSPMGRLGGGQYYEQIKVGHHHQARNRHPQRHRWSIRSHSMLLKATVPDASAI